MHVYGRVHVRNEDRSVLMSGRGVSLDKERHWERIIREAARSGMSVSEFCRRSKLREKQFYWGRATDTNVEPVSSPTVREGSAG